MSWCKKSANSWGNVITVTGAGVLLLMFGTIIAAVENRTTKMVDSPAPLGKVSSNLYPAPNSKPLRFEISQTITNISSSLSLTLFSRKLEVVDNGSH